MKSPKTIGVHALVMDALKRANITVHHTRGDEIVTEGGCRIVLLSKTRGNLWDQGDGCTRSLKLRGGGYGDGMHRSYPLRKDGTFNIQRLVDTVGEFHKTIVAQQARRDEKYAAERKREGEREVAAAELGEFLDMSGDDLATYEPRYSGTPVGDFMRVGVTPGGKVFAHLNFDTVEEAKAVLSKII